MSRRTVPLLPSLDQLGTFLLALLLALIVWVVAEQQKNPFEVRTVSRLQVVVRNLPDDLIMPEAINTLPQVDVRARAPRSVWQILTSNDLIAYIDLSQAQPGRQEVPVAIDAQVSGIEIQEINPPAVVVRLESRVSKDVPVTVSVLGSPPFGYRAGTATVTPPAVRVTGAKSLVDTVQQAEVSVRLTEVRSDFETNQVVILRDRNGLVVTGLEIDPRSVTVRVPIYQLQGVAEKSVLPRIEGQPAANYRITGVWAEPATVTLVGDPAVLAEMPPFVETTPITITDATTSIEERVPLVLPETVAATPTRAVVVRVGIEPIESSMTMTLTPVVQGLGQGLRVEAISPPTLSVLMQGPLPRLQTLTGDNVRAVLDLTGLGVGAHTLTPILVHPDGVNVRTLLPESVQVTIGPAVETPTSTPLTPRPVTPTPRS
ncbi:MAG: CdaR family protein [Caldilineales bacterium]|nr:CdaR family protein [Caldilineales bacterium]MCX7851440.1 CdaR family protein [Caldilineales bacterium]